MITSYFVAMRDALERHEGAVEKYIGDAVMAVFGIPSVREDDALRAVRAAAEMQTALEELNEQLEQRWGVRLQARTGVNTGEVIAGDAALGQGLVTGDAVNVAARLEQVATPGEILIGKHTFELVRDSVRVEAVPPLGPQGQERAGARLPPGRRGRARRDGRPAAALPARGARARARPSAGELSAHGCRAGMRAGDASRARRDR